MSMTSSIRWVSVGQAVRVVTQLVSTVVLARLLPASAYGLMAMAMTVTNLVYLFRDVGSSMALIQKKELDDKMVNTAHWLNICLGFASAVLLAALAYPLSLLFKQPELFPIICLLAIIFPASSFGLARQALLERTSQFRLIAFIESISGLSGLALGIVLAFSGAGIWSLVFQMVFSTCLASTLFILNCPSTLVGKLDRNSLRSLLSFGSNFSLFRCVIYFERNADSLIVGKYLGAHALGSYSMACKVMLFPLQNLTDVFSRATFPFFSQHQNSPELIKSMYLRSLVMIFIITAPLMAGAYMLRENFVLLVFGPKWLEVASIFQWLAPVGLIQALTASTGVVFLALGFTRLMLRLGVVGALLQVAGFVGGLHWGLQGVAAGFMLANLINLFPCFYYVLKVLKLPVNAVCSILLKPSISVGVMVLGLYYLDATHMLAMLSTPLRFLSSVLFGAGIYLFFLFILLRQSIADFRAFLKTG